MSHSTITTDTHTAYLWIPINQPSFDAVDTALRSAPRLAALSVSAHCDGEVAVLRLSFRADPDEYSAVRMWAAVEGLNLIMSSAGSDEDRRYVASELRRFRCRNQYSATEDATLALAWRLDRALRKSRPRSPRATTLITTPVPRTNSRDSGLRDAIARYLVEPAPVPPPPARRSGRTRTWQGQRSDLLLA